MLMKKSVVPYSTANQRRWRFHGIERCRSCFSPWIAARRIVLFPHQIGRNAIRIKPVGRRRGMISGIAWLAQTIEAHGLIAFSAEDRGEQLLC